jgi:hypothetical protein
MVSIETRQCPACPAWMVRRPTGVVLTSNPPQYPQEWWCACGHREPAGIDAGQTAEQETYGWWLAVNRQRKHEERQAIRAGRGFWRRAWDRIWGLG